MIQTCPNAQDTNTLSDHGLPEPTYFQCHGSIYEQTGGAAMGIPVSAVISDLDVESFEEQAVTSSP